MTTPLSPPSVANELHDHLRRIEALERLPQQVDFSPFPYAPGVQWFAGVQILASHTGNSSEMTVHRDSTVIHNAYARIAGNPTDDGPGTLGYFFPMVLGRFDGLYGPLAGVSGSDPETSYGLYWFHHIQRTGPNCGQYKLAVASAVIDGVLQPPQDTDLTWVPIYTSAQDLYTAGSSWGDPYSATSANYKDFYVRLTGTFGDIATAYNGPSPGTLDGGPGLYWFNLYGVGKNASSSDYLIDLAEFGASIGG